MQHVLPWVDMPVHIPTEVPLRAILVNFSKRFEKQCHYHHSFYINLHLILWTPTREIFPHTEKWKRIDVTYNCDLNFISSLGSKNGTNEELVPTWTVDDWNGTWHFYLDNAVQLWAVCWVSPKGTAKKTRWSDNQQYYLEMKASILPTFTASLQTLTCKMLAFFFFWQQSQHQ